MNNDYRNYGIIIKELDEVNIFKRSPSIFCDKKSKNPPRLLIIIRSDIKPDIEGIAEYEETWNRIYEKGIEALLSNNLNETIFYWIAALKRVDDEQIKSKIKEHIKTMTDFIREQQAKNKK